MKVAPYLPNNLHSSNCKQYYLKFCLANVFMGTLINGFSIPPSVKIVKADLKYLQIEVFLEFLVLTSLLAVLHVTGIGQMFLFVPFVFLLNGMLKMMQSDNRDIFVSLKFFWYTSVHVICRQRKRCENCTTILLSCLVSHLAPTRWT